MKRKPEAVIRLLLFHAEIAKRKTRKAQSDTGYHTALRSLFFSLRTLREKNTLRDHSPRIIFCN